MTFCSDACHADSSEERRAAEGHPHIGRSLGSYPKDSHAALIMGAMNCGKTAYVLDLLEGEYRSVFKNIIILCPSVHYNKTYQGRPWLWQDKGVFILNPGRCFNDCSRAFYKKCQGVKTLYIIDDCSALAEMTKKHDMLSTLTFSAAMQTKAYGSSPKNIMQS